MSILQTVFFTLIALGILVTIHEFGHFWVARRCGVKVLRFSIGFGTPLLRWHDRQGTEYVIAALPLGGYVKMADEREGEVASDELDSAFNRKSVWQRMAIVVAGPLANFILAVFFYWVIFLLGVSGVAPVVGSVAPDSIAERAGLEAGHEIIAVDDRATATWQDVAERLITRIGETGEVAIQVRDASGREFERRARIHQWLSAAEEPDVLGSFGIDFYRPDFLPKVGQVQAGSPAQQAGLEPGDVVISADGQSMNEWQQWVDYVRARPGERIELRLERDGRFVSVALVPEEHIAEDGSAYGLVGVIAEPPEWPEHMVRKVQYGPLAAVGQAMVKTGETTVMILDSIKKMVQGLISPKHLSGPITIAKVAGASAEYGLVSYLGFLALLSVSLGVLNLLPVPVLDGGHLMYYLVEAVKGSPVSEKVQMAGYRVGLFLVMGLMVLAFYNDLMRL